MRIGEHNFIRQLQLHNEDALLYVIDRYGGLLMSVIRRHLFRIPDRQEECFNDVLLKIWMNIPQFDESRTTFKNWAAAVARYRCIDYLRQYRKELETVGIDGVQVSGEDRALAGILEREISEEVETMLYCLSPPDRELFRKLYVEGMSMDQVSEETGMKKEVIYNRLSRGKNRIRRQYRRERGV